MCIEAHDHYAVGSNSVQPLFKSCPGKCTEHILLKSFFQTEISLRTKTRRLLCSPGSGNESTRLMRLVEVNNPRDGSSSVTSLLYSSANLFQCLRVTRNRPLT